MKLRIKKQNKTRAKTQDGKAYEIPVEGSLGLLASGYKGILLWREKRSAVIRAKNQSE
ncbi:MAG TPA: hypothetical protein PKC30_10220 [Saprospiraceae bacterium]|nr:hypothetical protein [Saprospiraceae bacterium]